MTAWSWCGHCRVDTVHWTRPFNTPCQSRSPAHYLDNTTHSSIAGQAVSLRAALDAQKIAVSERLSLTFARQDQEIADQVCFMQQSHLLLVTSAPSDCLGRNALCTTFGLSIHPRPVPQQSAPYKPLEEQSLHCSAATGVGSDRHNSLMCAGLTQNQIQLPFDAF